MDVLPAYTVPLTDAQLSLVGELTAIQGQIEELLLRTVTALLGLERRTASVILGSSKIADNTNIWATLIREKHTDPDLLLWVKHAKKEIEALAADRNDFVHAYFAFGTADLDRMLSEAPGGHPHIPKPHQTVVAARVRTGRRRDVADIRKVRDRAAVLSCMVAHIWSEATRLGGPCGKSGWLERIPRSSWPNSSA